MIMVDLVIGVQELYGGEKFLKGELMSCEHKNCKVIAKEETYPVFGVDTTIIANVKVCQDCGEEIFDYWLDGFLPF